MTQYFVLRLGMVVMRYCFERFLYASKIHRPRCGFVNKEADDFGFKVYRLKKNII